MVFTMFILVMTVGLMLAMLLYGEKGTGRRINYGNTSARISSGKKEDDEE